ncbi:hypothetical protein FZEAL_938 [Fusarium zealandicum]|uniref:LITAF domain-containing protein n=1 Tax=Fusarium zealandicum TaxID=1053134 RepID=A0A8H4UTR8_9HYPO|nr:hypothetical protein FZEAL_938 [Fusarium zealandicum]
MSSIATTVQTAGPAPAKTIPDRLIQAEDKVEPTPPEPVVVRATTGRGPEIEALPDVATVTPLHLLRKDPAWIDCPFCQRRTQTVVHTDGSPTQA